MEPFTLTKKSFGTILHIDHSPRYSDLQQLDQWFSNSVNIKVPIYIDLGKLDSVEELFVEYLLSQLNRLSLLGVPVTLVYKNSDLRETLQQMGYDKPVMILNYLDEATFPGEKEIRPNSVLPIQESPSASTCPSCKKEIRDGAYRCIHCGQMLIHRRYERHQVAIPFLYGKVKGKEFLHSNWLGGVTEDLDIHSFSGVGFFAPQEIPRGTEIHLLFPTIHWNKQKKDQSSITIFTGRIKHTAYADPWYRHGVALFDMFEYQGQFILKTEVMDTSA